MPALGILLIVVSVFIFFNTLNGNILNLVNGKLQLNFSGSSNTSSTNSSSNTPTVNPQSPSPTPFISAITGGAAK